MFTGLVADIGTVERMERSEDGATMRIATELAAKIEPGDSVAVNGACLTAAAGDGGGFEADVMNQTLRLTSLGPLKAGDRVNLELALSAGERLGGHLVQGHVDGTGTVVAVREDGFARRAEVEVPTEMTPYLAERGSVALDGVSLTVAALTERGLEVALVPETLDRTTLGEAREGRVVNVELDLVARYIERLMSRFVGGGSDDG